MARLNQPLVGFVILTVGILWGFWLLYQQGQRLDEQAAANRQATVALCIVRADREADLEQTDEFLEQNPGDTILGIPRTLIVQNRNEDAAVVRALSIIKCP